MIPFPAGFLEQVSRDVRQLGQASAALFRQLAVEHGLTEHLRDDRIPSSRRRENPAPVRLSMSLQAAGAARVDVAPESLAAIACPFCGRAGEQVAQ